MNANAKQCPVDSDFIFSNMLAGRFREVNASERELFKIDYSGYILRQQCGGDQITVVIEHGPGGLFIRVSNGTFDWTGYDDDLTLRLQS